MTLYQTMIVTWSILFLAPSSSWAQSIAAACSTIESLRSGRNFCHGLCDHCQRRVGDSYEVRHLFGYSYCGHF